jgi:SpoVK/Ycf46/Vps4 family AAA+-type ATPase
MNSSKLKTYLRSGYSGLYAITHEEERVGTELRALCKELKLDVWTWDAGKGLLNGSKKLESYGEPPKSTRVPQVSLMAYNDVRTVQKGEVREKVGQVIQNGSVLILRDFHLFLAKRDPEITRLVKDAILWGRETGRAIIIMAPVLMLPPELEKEFTVIDFPLPGREALLERAHALCKDKGVEMNGSKEAVIDAGLGLTMDEFSDACAASLTEHLSIVPEVVAEIKAATIKKGGLLEIIKPRVSFENIGGLDALKTWITKRKNAFGPEAAAFGVPVQKGVVLFGVQGAGKSIISQAIACEMNRPMLRLDMGRLFSGLVGSSEANVRAVIAQVEAFGPCVLQMDEIDKGFGGMVGGTDGDGGTTRRVIGSFLTWMAEKTSEVFLVATANDVTRLPAELLRKGRWDELFFIDLPTLKERCEIWRVQLLMKKRNPKDFDLTELAQQTEGWTGAEIEALIHEGLFAAFHAKATLGPAFDISTKMLLELSRETVPLSQTMAETMHDLRKWAKGRARTASAHEPEVQQEPGKRSFSE